MSKVQTRLVRKFKQRVAKAEETHKYRGQNAAAHLKSEVYTLLAHKLNRMHFLFIRWKTSQNSLFIDKLTDITSVWVQWLHYDIIEYQKEFIGRPIEYQKPTKIAYKFLKDSEEFWTSFDPFSDILPCVWRIRFTVKARLFLLKQTVDTRIKVLETIALYSTGFLSVDYTRCDSTSKVVKVGPCTNMVFFSGVIDSKLFVVFCTEMNRFPAVHKGFISYFVVRHHLKILGFCEYHKQVNEIIDAYLNSIKKHPDLYIEDEKISYKTNQSAQTRFRKVGDLFFPFVDSRIYLSPEESMNFKYDKVLKSWVHSGNAKQEPVELFYSNNPLIKKLASKEAGTNFVKILSNIPNFRIKLTEEQSEAVSKEGNVVILGRSGTGKTTCSVLRMFAAELLFRFKTNRSETNFGPDDIGKTTVLHSAFVTASPVLTNEVKRFYSKLKDHVKLELERRVKKKEAKDQNIEVIEIDEVKLKEQFSSSEDEGDEEDSGPISMNLLKDQDFPLFFTVRRLIFMIDASLRRPFFARDINGKVIGAGSNYEWHNEYKGSLKISRDYKAQINRTYELSKSDSSDEDELERSIDTENILKGFEQNRKFRSTQRSFEVDFKVFKDKFWPTIKLKTRLSALVIWTEITAYIKGSATSWIYQNYYLPKINYATRGQKVSLLTREEKLEVWDLFILYERWKVKHQAYDFQDIINYLLVQIEYHGYTGVPIHYMMVDEVQDLTPATIALLMSVSNEKLVFSGDTAQTIAKGVGFRFCDIEELFKEAGVVKPSIQHLTMNFRTHNQILGMANSIVSLLETLFPQTIDKMAKETSPIDGPLPLIINSNSYEELFHTLFGMNLSKDKSDIQFGCNQVIIVRTQEAKEKLHPLLSHALCLTVFEAKGLEFDDVILFNFFTDSEVSQDKWRILNNVKKVDIDTYYKNVEKYEELKKKVDKLKCLTMIDQSKLSLLCTELKNLYVAVTRPKKNLIIFDEDLSKRSAMQQFWDYMGVIQYFEKNENVEIDYQQIAQKTNSEAWKIQGDRMMSHKFYDQAAKCFSVSGDKLLETKARAFAKASKASSLITNSEAMLEEMEFENSKYRSRASLKCHIAEAEKMFVQAADELFFVYNEEKSKSLLKQVAQCFASGKSFFRAAEIYQEIGFLGQAAECFFSAGKFDIAAEIFNGKGEYVRAIECYSMCQDWDKLIHCLHKFRDLIPYDERKKYVYKYMPVALEALMPKILPNEQSGFIKKILDEQKDKIQEAKESDEDDSDETD